MTKDDFATTLASRTGLSKAAARDAIDCVFSTDPGEGIITGELAAGRDFTVTGFGTFGIRHRKARMGRNPRTGESIQIAAMNVPTFKAGKGLKDSVRG